MADAGAESALTGGAPPESSGDAGDPSAGNAEPAGKANDGAVEISETVDENGVPVGNTGDVDHGAEQDREMPIAKGDQDRGGLGATEAGVEHCEPGGGAEGGAGGGCEAQDDDGTDGMYNRLREFAFAAINEASCSTWSLTTCTTAVQ